MPSVEQRPGASSGQVRCSCRIEFVRAVLVRPLNGLLPNNSSYATTPSDQKSTGAEYPRFVKTSGAGVRSVRMGVQRTDSPMYAILPATPVSNRLSEKCTAMLKSVICAWPLSSSSTLSGLRSLRSAQTKTRFSKMQPTDARSSCDVDSPRPWRSRRRRTARLPRA